MMSSIHGENSTMTEGGTSIGGDTVFTGKVTHAERNLNRMNLKKKEDVDKLKFTVDEQKEELNELKRKYKAALARRDTLETQMKTIKTDYGSKMKMLLDKTENDDRLIQMLKQEISRLENSKGLKSMMPKGGEGGDGVAIELAKARRELVLLKNEVKCAEIKIEKRDEKIQQLMKSCVGAPDERVEEKDSMIVELQD